ncbi:MAG: GH3 auxin-responsive promoter family protein, partial [Pseudarcicella sp.]|nr:GH3 auxin-responsive promoter family protein [Pseudarcicella sp.]
MGIRSILAKPYAKYIHDKSQKWQQRPELTQQLWLHHLLKKARNTAFGKDFNFAEIENAKDFAQAVPIQDYEGLK